MIGKFLLKIETGGGCNSNNSKLVSTTLVELGSEIIYNRTYASTSVEQHLSKSSVHPLVVNQTLRLVAWEASGRNWPRKEFQQELKSLLQVPEDQTHLITDLPSVNVLAGVVNGK